MSKEHEKKIVYDVKPLKTKKDIDDMRQVLLSQGADRLTTGRTGRRNLMLFDFGCKTGLRVSDIVKLKVKDVAGVSHLEIREKKTGKVSRAYINKYLAQELKEYIKFMGLTLDDYLFPSRKGSKPISTTQVYRFLTAAGHVLGRDDIGTHTMRKTFGYQYYKAGGRIEVLQKILNHASPAVTRRYIGIDQDEIDDSLENFNF